MFSGRLVLTRYWMVFSCVRFFLDSDLTLGFSRLMDLGFWAWTEFLVFLQDWIFGTNGFVGFLSDGL